MNVLSRLKNVTASTKVVDVSKVFNGEKPKPDDLVALYMKNRGNILVFNEELFGKCYVKEFINSNNYTFIYYNPKTKSYDIEKVINGKEIKLSFTEELLKDIQKLK